MKYHFFETSHTRAAFSFPQCLFAESGRSLTGQVATGYAALRHVYRSHAITRLLIQTIFLAIIGVILGSLVMAGVQYGVRGVDDEAERFLPHRLVSIGNESSVAAHFRLSIILLTAFCFFLTYLLTRRRILFALAVTYGFIWLDDAVQYHEQVGTLLVSVLGLGSDLGRHAQGVGEMIAWAIAGSLLALVYLWSYLKSDRGDIVLGLLVAPTFILLVFFAVGVDTLHVELAALDSRLDFPLSVIENGGEMIATGMTAGVAVLIFTWLVLRPGETALQSGVATR